MGFDRKHVVIVFSIILFAIEPVLADEVYLKNGDRLTGTFISMQDGKLIFSTPYADKITVKWPEIVNLVTDTPVNVMLPDGSILKGISIPADGGEMQVKTEKIEKPIYLNLADVKAIYVKPAPAVKFNVRVNAGINVSKGNTDSETYHFDGEAVARTKKNRYTVGGVFNTEYTDKEKTADNSLGYMKYDHFLTKKLYLNTSASFEKDRFKDLNLRTTIGLSLGYQFFETARTNLSTEAGLAYINEDFDEAGDDSYPGGRWAINFEHYLFKKVVQLFHNQSGFVSLEDSDDIFVRTRTGLRFPFYKGFNLTAQYDYDWDNSVPADKDEADQRYILSLGYKF
jgi:putative salt-induced outer membrane protein YdiY